MRDNRKEGGINTAREESNKRQAKKALVSDKKSEERNRIDKNKKAPEQTPELNQ